MGILNAAVTCRTSLLPNTIKDRSGRKLATNNDWQSVNEDLWKDMGKRLRKEVKLNSRQKGFYRSTVVLTM